MREPLRGPARKRICTTLDQEKISSFFFQPLQFEVAFRARAEKIVHSFRNCSEQHWLEDDFVTFKVDMANAYNLVSSQAGHNLHLDTAEFQTALKWRLGIDMFGGSRCPSCSTHALTCGYNGDVTTNLGILHTGWCW